MKILHNKLHWLTNRYYIVHIHYTTYHLHPQLSSLQDSTQQAPLALQQVYSTMYIYNIPSSSSAQSSSRFYTTSSTGSPTGIYLVHSTHTTYHLPPQLSRLQDSTQQAPLAHQQVYSTYTLYNIPSSFSAQLSSRFYTTSSTGSPTGI